MIGRVGLHYRAGPAASLCHALRGIFTGAEQRCTMRGHAISFTFSAPQLQQPQVSSDDCSPLSSQTTGCPDGRCLFLDVQRGPGLLGSYCQDTAISVWMSAIPSPPHLTVPRSPSNISQRVLWSAARLPETAADRKETVTGQLGPNKLYASGLSALSPPPFYRVVRHRKTRQLLKPQRNEAHGLTGLV
jgi:hypothetical protein